jgi:hypothetical protein
MRFIVACVSLEVAHFRLRDGVFTEFCWLLKVMWFFSSSGLNDDVPFWELSFPSSKRTGSETRKVRTACEFRRHALPVPKILIGYSASEVP